MSIKIGDYTFDGPYTLNSSLKDRSGVYAIICRENRKYYLIDVGESAGVKTRIETHDRKSCWERKCQGVLFVAIYYTPNLQQLGRKAVEQKIRNQYRIPCGER